LHQLHSEPSFWTLLSALVRKAPVIVVEKTDDGAHFSARPVEEKSTGFSHT
jgi:hypothetical protein